MAVLNSNLKRFLFIASLLLSACANLESAANDLIDNSGLQEVAGAGNSSDVSTDVTSDIQEEGTSDLQATPTLSAVIESTAEPSPTPLSEEPVEATPTVEPTEKPSPTPQVSPTASPPPEPTPLPVSIRSNTADMLLVTGGEFEMGANASQLLEQCGLFQESCDEAWFSPSQPIHVVQLDAYYLDANEVTNEAFLEFLNGLQNIETDCDGQLCFEQDDSQIQADSEGLYTVDEAFFEHPVTGATWYGAAAFCEWRDARLPSEAEWELAASWNSESDTKSLYPWGDEFDGSALNYCDINCDEQQATSDFDDGFANTAPVGSYDNGRSPVGAYDMGGNVWEWVNDWFNEDYYLQSPTTNPDGPEEGDSKVVRGGSWFDTGNFSASAVRFPGPPIESGDSIGFRCAIDAVPKEEVLAQAPQDETTKDSAEATVEATAEATVEATAEVTAEATVEATAEVTVEATAEATVEATAEAEVTTEDSEASPAPVSINCNLQPGVDNGATYVVGACDWLAKIANRLGVSYNALLAANPQIVDPNLIYPGQVLNVPPRTNAAGPPPPSSNDPPRPPAQPPGGLGR